MKKELLFAVFALSILSATSSVVTYPAPEESPLNDRFAVEVRQGSMPWQKFDVYSVKVDKTTGVKHEAVPTSMAYFDFDGEVDVRVVSREKIKEARVRPDSYGIATEISGDTILFSLDRPRQVVVQVNGDIFNNLHLFANPLDINRPADLKKWAKQKDNLYFAPGYHKLDSTLVVGSGTTVYIDGGAVIEGDIHVKGHDINLYGRGMIYPERAVGIYVMNSDNVVIEGLFSTQCAVGGSRNVTVENVKVMSSYGWGDGFNVFASSDVTYRNIFARTSDDCTTVYATRKGFTGGCDNIVTEGAVLWADVAHPFMIGIHGNVENPDTISNIVYRDIDILDTHEPQLDYQGVFAIITGDNNLVENVTFDNVRIEDFRLTRLFDIRVAYNKKYCGAPGNSIRNVTFKDIYYNGDNSETSLIIGYDDNRTVDGVHFINLNINGTKIYDDMPGKPKWYKTSDMGRIFIGEHVENVTFE